jgi:hypothetical protein
VSGNPVLYCTYFDCDIFVHCSQDALNGSFFVCVLQCGPTSLLAILQTLEKLRRDLQALCTLAEKDLQSSLLQDLFKNTICMLSNIQPFLDNLNQQAVR